MFYQYHICFYSEIVDDDLHAQGIVSAESYADAARQLEEDYSLVSIDYLESLGPILDKDLIENLVWEWED